MPDNTGTIIEQMAKLLNSLKAQTHQVQEVQAQTTSETWDLSQAAKLPQTATDSSELLAEVKTTYKPNTDNDSEQPRTTNTKNNQTQQSLPRAPQNQQKQADSQSQPNQVERTPKTSQRAATAPTGIAEILSIHINNTQTLTYSTTVGDSNVKALFDSGANLSCISK